MGWEGLDSIVASGIVQISSVCWMEGRGVVIV